MKMLNVGQGLIRGVLAAITVTFLAGCGCCTAERHKPGPHDESAFSERTVRSASGRSYPMDVTPRRGRPILLLHEINGQTPACLDFALELSRRGAQVYVPRLFGKHGEQLDLRAMLWIARNSVDGFDVRNPDDMGPVRGEMLSFIAEIRRDHPGQAITVVGNCLTGSLPLEVLSEPDVSTVVLCQPTLPVRGLRKPPAGKFGIPEEKIEAAFASVRSDPGKRMITLGYHSDRYSNAHVYAIADRIKAEGLSGRHRLIVGFSRSKSSEMARLGREYPASWSPIIIRDRRGHSTVTAPNQADREMFRQAVYSELGLTAAPTTRPRGSL